MRLTASCRAKALEAGQWQKADGSFVAVRAMPDGHLINALLKALADGEPDTITTPLTAELLARGLVEAAYRVAAARDGRRA